MVWTHPPTGPGPVPPDLQIHGYFQRGVTLSPPRTNHENELGMTRDSDTKLDFDPYDCTPGDTFDAFEQRLMLNATLTSRRTTLT